MDGSGVGRGGSALMFHVIYKGRALPLAWRVRQCPKGHFPQELHIALGELVSEWLPQGTQVVFLDDGDCDGIDLQATVNDRGWQYACRTSTSTKATWSSATFALSEWGACLKPGRLIELKEVVFTREASGPVRVLCCWAKGHAEPLYGVRNMSSAEEAMGYDAKRFRIEPFFSDQKSRGFNLHKSRLEDRQRLSRLLIACCLAYIWLVYLGS